MFDLKHFRKANKMSQKDAAAYFEVGQSFISMIEGGKNKIPASFISKILADDNIDKSMLDIKGAGVPIKQLELDFSKVADACQKAASAAEESATTGRILAQSNSKLVDDNSKVLYKLIESIARIEKKLDEKGGAEDANGVAKREAQG